MSPRPQAYRAKDEPRGWFADIDEDTGPSDPYRWQPCLETGAGHIPCFSVWFATEDECTQWIRENVLGVGLLP